MLNKAEPVLSAFLDGDLLIVNQLKGFLYLTALFDVEKVNKVVHRRHGELHRRQVSLKLLV